MYGQSWKYCESYREGKERVQTQGGEKRAAIKRQTETTMERIRKRGRQIKRKK